jgi:cbb3-type cytochrome oxidase cytochrome c subunit
MKKLQSMDFCVDTISKQVTVTYDIKELHKEKERLIESIAMDQEHMTNAIAKYQARLDEVNALIAEAKAVGVEIETKKGESA